MRTEPMLVFRNTKGKDINKFLLLYPCVPRVGDIVSCIKRDPYKVTQVLWMSYESSCYGRINTEIQITLDKLK